MRVTKTLPVPLSEHELANLADDLVGVLEHRDEITAEAKSVADGYKKQIAATEKDEADLRRQINSKERMDDVECLETEIPGTNEVVTVRLDTGAEIERRQLTTAETQSNMFAELEVDELRQRVLDTLALRDALKTAGVNATSDVLWQITPEQADEAKAYVATKQENPDAEVEQPTWLADLIASHPAVHEEVEHSDTTDSSGDDTGDGDSEVAAEATGEATAEPSAAASEQETASGAAPAAADQTGDGKAPAKRKKKAAKTDATVESKQQAEHAAASNGRLDEVDVQEELDAAGISVGLDVIAGWTEPQLIDAVNFAKVVVARRTNDQIEEPKRPAFLPA